MSNRPGNRRRLYGGARVAALACVGLLSFVACSASDDDGSDATASSTQESAQREGANAAQDGRDSAGGQVDTAENATPIAVQNRAIERHGSLRIASKNVPDARDSVIADIKSQGGYVADEESSTNDAGALDRVQLELVVPTDHFDEAMTSSASAGEIVSRKQSAKDVTDKVVDVNSRVDNAKSSLHRIRQLLGRAEKLGDVIRLESVLGQREADLESLQARQKSLQQRTTTATIDVTINATAKDEPTKKTEDDSGFVAGLEAGWSGLQTAWAGVATVLGAVLPFVLALAIPVVLAGLLVRRVLRGRTATT